MVHTVHVHLSIEWNWKIIQFFPHDSTDLKRENLFHAFGWFSFLPLFLSFLFVEMHYQDEKESSVWIWLEISIRISPEYKHAPNRKESSSFLFGFAFYFFCVPLRKNLWQIFTLFEKVLQYQRNRSQNATVHNLWSCLCNKVIPSKDIQFGSRISIQFFLPTIPFNIFASKREPLALRSIFIVYLT